MEQKKILCVIGTRPEAIKMAPVIHALKNQSWAKTVVLATAQHREMLDQVLSLFNIMPDIDLNLMMVDQSLAKITTKLLAGLDLVLADEKPSVVIAQGDTTTTMVTAMACFYRRIPFCHVEAGLRTHDLSKPFPEEMNRVITAKLTTLHFAPTKEARRNLLQEGIDKSYIYVTGNTVIDALLHTVSKDISIGYQGSAEKRLVLFTVHRRESFGESLRNILRAVYQIADEIDDIEIVYPVHLNPEVRQCAYEELSGHPS